ncbi:hypothetical protein QQX09_13280 [Demequina sp. SYSU T00192]|uniref:Yip1 domain-containing protein n=1 Tax=Demequina litoralis TaxID=3051660 RepID=A0ABT8GCG2_9MICO|nr:hypothetical protein [Demequina sp. SYSU T00192]MDN4476826.1 hypothetical protein [Demequina sp. SYSU T00192]
MAHAIDPVPAPALESPEAAAWVAAAVTIPLYAVLGSACAFTGAMVWESLTGGGAGVRLRLDQTEVAVFLATALIVAVGIVVTAHTAGRWLHERTADQPTSRAVGSFAMLGGALALAPALAIVIGSDDPASAVFVLLGLVLPCAVTAALARVVVPLVASSTVAIAAVAVLAALFTLVAVTLLAATWATWPLGTARG